MKVYVALLSKKSELGQGCFENLWCPRQTLCEWIVLGHFDAVQLYELDTRSENLFKAIHRNNLEIARHNDAGKYAYPIYLISDKNENAFWKGDEGFFAVVRIHLSRSIDVNDEFDLLVKQLRDDKDSETCKYICCRTVELSDMILAVKSKRLSDLLGFTLRLQKYDTVGKTYTYGGICFNKLMDISWLPDKEDMVDFFSIRFSMVQPELYEKQVRLIQEIIGDERAYSIVGVDDFALAGKELPVVKLVDLHRKWFLRTEGVGSGLGAGISDVTTRVGIALERLGKNRRDIVESERKLLQSACQKLGDKYREMEVAGRFGADCQWGTALSGLLDGLTRISRSTVLDEFAYLMYPGVDSFLKNLEQGRLISPRDDQDCYEFIENWSHLMEHIMRIEGELSYYPEVRAVIYDIPVAMLEYILAFLGEVAQFLQQPDEQKVQISFLIVPRLCERIEAHEIAMADTYAPGLVLIKLPIRNLYNPYDVQMELCHEVSHFVGEKYRERDFRLHSFVGSAAALISAEIFGTTNRLLTSAVEVELLNRMEPLKEQHIRKMRRRVVEWLNELCNNPSMKYDFIRRLAEETVKHRERFHVPLGRFDVDIEAVTRVEVLLEQVSVLYREIYADICMLLLLNVDIRHYIGRILKEMEPEGGNDKDTPYEQFAIRVFVALKSTKNKCPEICNQRFDAELSKLELYMSDENKERPVDRAVNDNRMFPIETIRFLLKYASHCADGIRDKVTESGGSIHKIFNNVSSDSVEYNDFLNVISNYRCKVIKQYMSL